jgi:hypothetical protein
MDFLDLKLHQRAYELVNCFDLTNQLEYVS